MTTDGFYEMSVDFIEIPREGPQPDCETTSYARYMSIGDAPWDVPPAPNGSIGYVIEYSLFTSFPIVTGTGDVPPIEITSQTPGFGSPTANGCPVHIAVTYLCPDSPVIPDIDFVSTGVAKDDFVSIAELTTNPSQKTQLDRILVMVGRDADGDYSDLWATVYDEAQAFLLANPNYILDMSELEMINISLINTLTELKKLNLNHNLLGGFDIDQMDRLELTHIEMQYNLLGGTHDKKFQFMLSTGLVYIDLAHNQMQEYFLFDASDGGANWEVDYVDLSYNFFATGVYTYMQTKSFKFTHNTFPAVDFWNDKYNDGDGQILTSEFGSNFEDITLLDITDTQLRYSFGIIDPTKTPDDEVALLLARIEADGHTALEAQTILVRNPKWENIPHDPYDPSDIF